MFPLSPSLHFSAGSTKPYFVHPPSAERTLAKELKKPYSERKYSKLSPSRLIRVPTFCSPNHLDVFKQAFSELPLEAFSPNFRRNRSIYEQHPFYRCNLSAVYDTETNHYQGRILKGRHYTSGERLSLSPKLRGALNAVIHDFLKVSRSAYPELKPFLKSPYLSFEIEFQRRYYPVGEELPVAERHADGGSLVSLVLPIQLPSRSKGGIFSLSPLKRIRGQLMTTLPSVARRKSKENEALIFIDFPSTKIGIPKNLHEVSPMKALRVARAKEQPDSIPRDLLILRLKRSDPDEVERAIKKPNKLSQALDAIERNFDVWS